MQSVKHWGESVLAPLINPAQFDFWAQQLGSIHAWKRCFARLVSVQTEGRDSKTLTLKPNRNWRGFAAGQHCNVTAVIAGRNITRSYSMSCASTDDRHIEITVRRKTGGLMSEYLYNRIQVGDRLELGSAFGEMVLPVPMPAHLLLLAAGSGITPMMSQIRTLSSMAMPAPVTLVYWEKTASDFNFTEELASISRQTPDFNVHLITTREHGDQPISGRISHELLGRLPNLDAVDHVFACGADGFVQTAASVCRLRQWPLKSEAFTPPPAQPATIEITEHEVYLRRRAQVLRVSNQLPLLEQLERAGVCVPSGCRQGICNTCTCVRSSGSTADIASGAADNEPSQVIRLCISRAASDIELDL